MNTNRRLQPVPQYLVDAGLQYGEELKAHYAAGGSPRSRSRSGDRGTERNVRRMAQGKIGEVAVALWFGLDPNSAVKWDCSRADDGTDLIVHGVRIDVKTNHFSQLLWSRDVNDLYFEKRFDVMVGVTIDRHEFGNCWIEGFISKGAFFREKVIAGGQVAPWLQRDTWHVDKSTLINIDRFGLWSLEFRRAARARVSFAEIWKAPYYNDDGTRAAHAAR